mgnify:CR=1 FL=1
MPKNYTMVVLTNPVEGREDAFNRWYTDVHIHDVIKTPGFRSARRFKAADSADGEAPKYRYFASYEVETDDLPAVLQDLSARYGTDDMVATDTMQEDVLAFAYEAITPLVSK